MFCVRAMRRVAILIHLIIYTFGHLLAVDEKDITLELHFIYLVIKNDSGLQQNDIALIESSSSYMIEEIIESEKDHNDSFVISNVSSQPSDRIYDNGFCIPTGNFTNCFVLNGVMTIKASGFIDEAVTRLYDVIKDVLNNGLVFLPFDGIIYYYKAAEQTSMIHPPTPVEISTKAAIMLPILVSVGAFICTAAIMYFLCYPTSTSSSKSAIDNEREDLEEDERRLGIRANDLLLAKAWVALKLPSSLYSFSLESLASDDHSFPRIFTASMSSDCCSSVSDISAKEMDIVADSSSVNIGTRLKVEI